MLCQSAYSQISNSAEQPTETAIPRLSHRSSRRGINWFVRGRAQGAEIVIRGSKRPMVISDESDCLGANIDVKAEICVKSIGHPRASGTVPFLERDSGPLPRRTRRLRRISKNKERDLGLRLLLCTLISYSPPLTASKPGRLC